MDYKPKDIEKKLREKWESNGDHIIDLNSSKPKYYCLDMFPYPSGEGLHVGHWRGYVLSDVLARYKRLQGYNVLHPMGWDSFGLPAENAAIKKDIHPKINTKKNIDNMKRQLSEIGAMYDWSKEISTSSPEYYKWTQWIFLQMYKKNLAYKKEMPINWCKSCKTGLANEEVVNGLCDRCGSDVVKKPMSQWMLKITEYAERLLDGLDNLNWPNKVKIMQKNWIGKSEGSTITFKVICQNNDTYDLDVFTTRPDTLFGATYVVLAPEHKLVSSITSDEQKKSVHEYIDKASQMSEMDRTDLSKEKTGAFVGAYAINPVNQKKIPVWISEYVLEHYGCGAIMSVPAHDDRDFEFAKKFNLPIVEVIRNEENENSNILEKAYTGHGILINSGNFNNLNSEKAKTEIINWLESNKKGKMTITYKLRDWVFARQRYWGEPIPIIYCPKCGEVPVKEKDLPVLLPHIESYKPSGTGKSPLANIPEFVNTTCPECLGAAERETDTMPQWAGSSWYFLRYINPDFNDFPFKKDEADKWLPVDYYVGGVEHAILHLLYARFFTKVLYDMKYINFDEPFKKLFNQGMVCKYSEKTKKLEKMSKSKGNNVNPDALVEKYGTDTLRLYELFIGDPELDCEWIDNGIEGIYKFLKKSWTWINKNINNCSGNDDKIVLQKLNILIYQITQRLDSLKFNTAISAFMEFMNFMTANSNKVKFSKVTIEKFVILLAPFAPHISEELWQILGNKNTIFTEEYPLCDENYLYSDELEIVIQVNGKLKGKVTVAKGVDQSIVEEAAYKIENIKNFVVDKNIKKKIFVKDKLLNFVL